MWYAEEGVVSTRRTGREGKPLAEGAHGKFTMEEVEPSLSVQDGDRRGER